jgi:eukaryotic-like serine/threonine-protein kinase
VEDDAYEPGSLAHIASEDDELGRLARVFDRLVFGMRAKETQLRRRLDVLRREVRDSGSLSVSAVAQGDATTLAIHRVLADRYEILDELGRGGMGRVYRAHDRELREEIAIKVLRRDVLSNDVNLVDRLRAESRLARRITHQNVVRVYDFGEHDGAFFLTMELVHGVTVENLIESRGRLASAATHALAAQLAEALAVAHQHGVIHRDIKPANLLVDNHGVLKVMDFGLARPADTSKRLTMQGSVVGTPRYMAPEQFMDGNVDARSDLYSMGVVLYECLTGVVPFAASSPMAMIARMMEGPPTPIAHLVSDVSPAFVAVVDQLLCYDVAKRPASAHKVAEQLRGIT